MSVDPTPSRKNISCPRCGYDLRGVIESWKHECPISGVCSECGLEFEWSELLSPHHTVARWCVEYAWGWRIVESSFKTLLLILFSPARFWRELKMVHTTRWIGIPAIILPAAVILYLILSISVGVHVHKSYLRAIAGGLKPAHSPIIDGLYAAVNPFSTNSVSYTTVLRTVPPRTYTRSGSTSRPRTILYRKIDAFRYIVKDTLRAVRYGGFFLPFRQGQDGVVFAHVLLMAALCPLAFFALPRSLRQAKVRRAHILRIWCYSAGILVWPTALMVFSPIGPDLLWQWWREGREFVIVTLQPFVAVGGGRGGSWPVAA